MAASAATEDVTYVQALLVPWVKARAWKAEKKRDGRWRDLCGYNLAKKHTDCLEYILVHEMAHYIERNHGERFTNLMDGYLPDWRRRRDQLNDWPLTEETWQ